MKWPFNRIEALIFASVFPLFFLLHWNGFLGFFYEGIANKIGSTTGFGPALISATAIYLVVLVGYYFLKKIKHDLFANRWRAAAIIGGFILILLGSGYFFLRDFWRVDTCLEKGGAWNYQVKQCETIQSAWTKEKFASLRSELPDLPPFGKVELEHQAWVYAANKLFQDQICTGNTYYNSEIPREMVLQKISVADGDLVKILCNNTAYNTDYVLLLQQDTDLSVVEFNEIEIDTGERIPSKTAFGVDYDEAKNIFTTFYKLRGLGDCGTQGTYSWNTETKQLELQEFRRKDECDGKNGDWPVVFDIDAVTTNEALTDENIIPEAEVLRKKFKVGAVFALLPGQPVFNAEKNIEIQLQKFIYEPCTEICVWEGPHQAVISFKQGDQEILFEDQLSTDGAFNTEIFGLNVSGTTDFQSSVKLTLSPVL